MGINHIMLKMVLGSKMRKYVSKQEKKLDTGSRFRASGVSKSKRHRRWKKVKTGWLRYHLSKYQKLFFILPRVSLLHVPNT